jgi:cysteinyl-tRNA synthetase
VRTIRELLGRYRGEVLRFALLSAHYRSPLKFSAELLDQAEQVLNGFYTALRDVQHIELDVDVVLADEGFYAALCDDLNTPLAISEMHILSRELNKAVEADKPALKARLLAAGNLLGVLAQTPTAWLQGAPVDDESDALNADAIEALIAERAAAKSARDYARADEIREQLADAGVALEDGPDGTLWRRQ